MNTKKIKENVRKRPQKVKLKRVEYLSILLYLKLNGTAKIS